MKGVDCMFQKEPGSEEWNSVAKEWFKYFFCMSNYTLPPLIYGFLRNIFMGIGENNLKRMNRSNERVRAAFKEKLGDDAVLILPAFPDAADYHNAMYHKFLNVSYLIVFNACEMPVTACPMGLNSSGIPLGIQIAANPLQDRLSIAVAQELEKQFGGWIPPPANEKIV